MSKARYGTVDKGAARATSATALRRSSLAAPNSRQYLCQLSIKPSQDIYSKLHPDKCNYQLHGGTRSIIDQMLYQREEHGQLDNKGEAGKRVDIMKDT